MRLTTMLWLCVAVAAAVFVARPREVVAWFEAMYPSDDAHRAALAVCIERDRSFNRADRDEREACYRREIAVPSPPDFAGPRRAGGRGPQPASDILRHEREAGYRRPAWR